MTPAEKTSLIGSLLVVISFIFIISGATKPGVPHLTNKYLFSSAKVASPKSQIPSYKLFYFLNIIFYGFKSL
jgi:hypothetical protein